MESKLVGSQISGRILALHKPKGYEVTRPKTLGEQRYPGQMTVYSLLPSEFHSRRWMPVGRLDKNSSGLLLFVWEGPLAFRMQTPGHIDKTYEVWVKGHLNQEHLQKVLRGVATPIGILKAKSVEVLGMVGPNSLVEVVLDEGKNRHIRRMFGCLKDLGPNRFFKTLDLTRTSIGPISLDLEPGQWRFLTEIETKMLLESVPANKKTPRKITSPL
jgi:23S rRNA pseudouridine2605 synthase